MCGSVVTVGAWFVSANRRQGSFVSSFGAGWINKTHGCDFEYEYPYFIRSADGLYHLVYSWNNTFIKHVSFNDAWLLEQL